MWFLSGGSGSKINILCRLGTGMRFPAMNLSGSNHFHGYIVICQRRFGYDKLIWTGSTKEIVTNMNAHICERHRERERDWVYIRNRRQHTAFSLKHLDIMWRNRHGLWQTALFWTRCVSPASPPSFPCWPIFLLRLPSKCDHFSTCFLHIFSLGKCPWTEHGSYDIHSLHMFAQLVQCTTRGPLTL